MPVDVSRAKPDGEKRRGKQHESTFFSNGVTVPDHGLSLAPEGLWSSWLSFLAKATGRKIPVLSLVQGGCLCALLGVCTLACLNFKTAVGFRSRALS